MLMNRVQMLMNPIQMFTMSVHMFREGGYWALRAGILLLEAWDMPIFDTGILSALPRRYLAVNDAILGVNMNMGTMTA